MVQALYYFFALLAVLGVYGLLWLSKPKRR